MAIIPHKFSVCAGHAVGAVVWAYWGVGEAAEPCGVYDSGDTIGNTPVSIAAAASAAASSIVAEVTDCLMPSDLDNLD